MHADDAHKLAEQHFATLVAALEAGRSDALVRYLFFKATMPIIRPIDQSTYWKLIAHRKASGV